MEISVQELRRSYQARGFIAMPDVEIQCSHKCGHMMARKVMRYSRSANKGTGGFLVAQDTDRRPVSEMARARKNTQTYWKDRLCLDCYQHSSAD